MAEQTNGTRISIDEHTNFLELSRINAKIPVESLLRFKDRWNWTLISTYQHFSLFELGYLENFVNFRMLFKTQPFDRAIADRYKEFLDWDFISGNCALDVSDYYAFRDYINWDYMLPNTIVFQQANLDTIEKLKDYLDWYHYHDSPVRFDIEFLRKYKEELYWKDIDFLNRWSKPFIFEFADYIPWDYIATDYPSLITEDVIAIGARELLDNDRNQNKPIATHLNSCSDEVLIMVMHHINGFTSLGCKTFAGNEYLKTLVDTVVSNSDVLILAEALRRVIHDVLINNIRLNKDSIEILNTAICESLDVKEICEDTELGTLETILPLYAYNPAPNKQVVDYINALLGYNIFADDTKCSKPTEYVGVFMSRFGDLALNENFANNIDNYIDIIAEYGSAENRALLAQLITTHPSFEDVDEEERTKALNKLNHIDTHRNDQLIPNPPEEETDATDNNDE